MIPDWTATSGLLASIRAYPETSEEDERLRWPC